MLLRFSFPWLYVFIILHLYNSISLHVYIPTSVYLILNLPLFHSIKSAPHSDSELPACGCVKRSRCLCSSVSILLYLYMSTILHIYISIILYFYASTFLYLKIKAATASYFQRQSLPCQPFCRPSTTASTCTVVPSTENTTL